MDNFKARQSMIKINDKTILDTKTGILYTLSDGWNFGSTYEEAKANGELWAKVYITSIHAPENTTDIVMEKQDAVSFWECLCVMAAGQ